MAKKTAKLDPIKVADELRVGINTLSNHLDLESEFQPLLAAIENAIKILDPPAELTPAQKKELEAAMKAAENYGQL